jgi:hypothetical protein
MRMCRAALLLIAIGMGADGFAQNAQNPQSTGGPDAPPASAPAAAVPAQAEPSPSQDAPSYDLPVSLDRIRKSLERPPLFPIQGLRDQPTFRVEVQERNRLQDILSTLDFTGGPTPAGGLYAAEMQRVMFPSVSNPLRQPFAAFNQPELLTIIIETLTGTYLVKKAASALNQAERDAAEAAARDDLRRAVLQYCAGQPNGGAGIAICESPPAPAGVQ